MRLMKPASANGLRIATKITALSALCALIALTGAWILLARMQATIERHQQVLTSFMDQVDLARRMQVDFKNELARERHETAVGVTGIFLVLLGSGAVIARRIVTPIDNLIRTQSEVLRERDERFRCVTQTASDAVVVADERGTIISWNVGARAMFGYAESEALGRPLRILMPERFRAAHSKGLERFSSTGRPQVIGKTVELQGLRQDGSEFPIELSLSHWTARGESFYGSIIRDITERKRIEEEFRRLNDELERRVVERTQQLQEVHEQLRNASHEAGMAEVATNVLHNVGNVLNSVNVSANLVAQHAQMSTAAGLAKVVALLREHEHDLATFITADARGRHLVAHLSERAQRWHWPGRDLHARTAAAVRSPAAGAIFGGKLKCKPSPVAVSDRLVESIFGAGERREGRAHLR